MCNRDNVGEALDGWIDMIHKVLLYVLHLCTQVNTLQYNYYCKTETHDHTTSTKSGKYEIEATVIVIHPLHCTPK